MSTPPKGPPESSSSDNVSLDRLTADFAVYQRKGGHRFSSDDLVTAWVAKQVCPSPTRILDLGCGLGSVLLHLAWSTPSATLVGIEAQDISFDLVRRNIAHNDIGHRVVAHHGDIRDASVLATVGTGFDLVTGTPPYFPISTAVDALDPQRAYARIEYRGGVEAYALAASQCLAPEGWFVMCGDADADDRAVAAGEAAGFVLCGRTIVIPREQRPALFTVWTMRFAAASPVSFVERGLTLRDADGERTADARMLRAASGFPEKN